MVSLTHVDVGESGQKRSSEGGFDRTEFWRYCVITEQAARQRSIKIGIPCTVDRYYIDGLLVDQKWRCAVSGLVLHPPRSSDEFARNPFSPSLDRITPALGYVAGNVRIVCTMVNLAMNEWGLENLNILVRAMASRNQGLTGVGNG